MSVEVVNVGIEISVSCVTALGSHLRLDYLFVSKNLRLGII